MQATLVEADADVHQAKARRIVGDITKLPKLLRAKRKASLDVRLLRQSGHCSNVLRGLLLAQSGHPIVVCQCPLLGVKQT